MISKERLEIFKDTQHVLLIGRLKFNLIESMKIKKIDVIETLKKIHN